MQDTVIRIDLEPGDAPEVARQCRSSEQVLVNAEVDYNHYSETSQLVLTYSARKTD